MFGSIKYDCKYFDGAKPCKPHKQTGVFCDTCEVYSSLKEKILIIKFAASGDVLRTTSILPAIKKKYPNSAIYWITAPHAIQIFENNPHVQKVYSDSAEYLPFISAVSFDIIYNLESDKNSAALASVTKASQKYGYLLDSNGYVVPATPLSNEWFLMGVHDGYKKANTKTYFEHMYHYAELSGEIFPPELFLSESETKITSDFIERHGLHSAKKVVGINTGSGKRWPLKKWGKSDYITLLQILHEKHPEFIPVLFGGPEEIEFNEELKNALGFEIIDAGCKNNLRTFFALVDATDVFLTPDSLAMHVAIALKKQTLVYVGPTSSAELDVFGKGSIIHSEIECLVCYLNRCEKQVNCMNTISVEKMYSELIKLCEM